MRKCCVLTCGACHSDGVSLFNFPRNPRLRSKWIRMVNRDRSSISCSTVVCSRHFPEHLVGTKAKPRLKRGSFPTLQLQEASTASTGRKRLRSRAGPHKVPAISACGAFSSEDADSLSSSHDHLYVEEATITVVKQEPEEILDTPTRESLCSEDYSAPLRLEGEEDKTCAVKEEVDSVSAASTCGDGYLEDAVCLHPSAECPEQAETASLRVKEEPDEFAPALGMEGEGKTSEAFDSMAFLPVLLEGQRRDGSLHVIEVPDEILPTPTGGPFRSEDCKKVYCPQPGLEGHNKSCVVKEDAVDVPEGSSDCGGSLSLSSSQERSDQECLDEQVNPRHGCSFGTWSSICTSKIIVIEGTQTEEASKKHCLTTCEEIQTDERPFKYLECPKAFQTKPPLRGHKLSHSGERPFKCPYCPKVFQTKPRLKEHKISHSDKRPFKCPSCPKAFEIKSSLAMHKRFHSDERPFKCPSCSKAFKIKSHLTTHKLSHSDERPFKCPICPKAFQRKYCLVVHKISHSDERPFKCPYCPEAFKKKSDLTTHKLSHSDERFKCPICLKAFKKKSLLTTHKISHSDERPFKCSICPKAFQRKPYLMAHKISHSDKRSFKCPICLKAFQRKSYLMQHKISHSDKRPFKCPICPKAFKSKSVLAVHKLLHSDERPFICPICAKAFKRKSVLTVHKQFHSDKRSFKCPICPKEFQMKSTLTAHKLCHSDERPFKCPICPKAYKKKSSLTTHKISHSDERPLKCPSRPNSYCSQSSLSVHTRLHQIGERTFKCESCDRSFAEKRHLTSHELIHAGPKPFTFSSSSEDFRFRAKLNDHKTIHVPVAYKCPTCPKSFRTKFYLNVHEKLHKNETTRLKDICQKSSMNSHKAIHECKGTSNTCDKLFEQRMGLSRPQPTICDLPPVAMHTGGRLFKSGTCPKELSGKSSSSLHERLHSGKMPYKSETLDAAFLWKYKPVGCRQNQLIKNHVICHTSSEALCKESHLSAHGKIHQDELTCNPSTHAIAATEEEHPHQVVHKSEGLSKCPVQPKVVKLNLPLQSKLSFQLKLPLNLLSNYKGTIYKCSTCTMAFTNEQHLNAHQAAHTG